MTFRQWIWRGILIVLLVGAPGPAHGADANLGVVQLAVNQTSGIPDLDTWFDEQEQPFLLFNAFMTGVELPIQFDPTLGHASDMLPDGQTTYDLNLQRATLDVGGNVSTLPKDAIHLGDKGLYVRWDWIARGLPLDLAWSVEAYEVRVTTAYPLPSARAKAQEYLRRQLLASREEESQNPHVAPPVPWFDPGMLQIQANATRDHKGHHQENLTLSGVHRVFKGDLEYAVTQPYVDGKQTKGRVDYGRLNYYTEERNMGLTLGDTYAAFSPLVMPIGAFRGAYAYRGQRNNMFGGASLVGTAPLGASVDLYRWGVLVDTTRVDGQGFYTFNNIPLNGEATVFEAHVFTPDGRHDVHIHRITSHENILPQGEWAAQLGAGKNQVPTNPYQLQGGEVRYGLTNGLTLGGYDITLDQYTLPTNQTLPKMNLTGAFVLWRPLDWMVLLGEASQNTRARGSADRVSWFNGLGFGNITWERRRFREEYYAPARRLDVEFTTPAWEKESNEVKFTTRLWATNLQLSTLQADMGQQRTWQRNALRMDRRLWENLDANVTLGQEHRQEENQLPARKDTAELFSTYRINSLNHITLNLKQEKLSHLGTNQRAGISYQKNYLVQSPWSVLLSYNQANTVNQKPETVMAAGLGYLFTNNLRVAGDADGKGGWRISMEYIQPFRISEEGVQGFDKEKYRTAGLEGTVFLDQNGDGIRQPEEPPVSQVRVVAPGMDNVYSDKEGHYKGWGLPNDMPQALQLDMMTLDALYMPLHEKYLLTPRPGALVHQDFPVVPNGGLSGLIQVSGRKGAPEVDGLELELIGADGRVVNHTLVENDGSFVMEGIRPGNYALRANPEEAKRRGLELYPERMPLVFKAGLEPTWMDNLRLTLGGPQKPEKNPKATKPAKALKKK